MIVQTDVQTVQMEVADEIARAVTDALATSVGP
jgi:hypothetical protein